MNTFPFDFQDFVYGRAIDSTVKQATLGLQTEGQRQRFVNEIIGDMNALTDDVAQGASVGQRAAGEATYLSRFDDGTGEAVSIIREHFRNAATGRDIGDVRSAVAERMNKTFYKFTYNDFRESIFNGPLAQAIDNFKSTFPGLVPGRYAMIGVGIIGGLAYFTIGTAEASEAEISENEDIESNVHIYINMTEAELQAQKDRIASDIQLLLYEQSRDEQRHSNRPGF